MTVTHTEDQIEVETKLIMPDNERTVKDSYVLVYAVGTAKRPS